MTQTASTTRPAATAAEMEGASEYRRLLGPGNADDAGGSKLFEELLKRDFTKRVQYEPFLGGEGEKVMLTPAMVTRFLCKPTKSGLACTEEQATRFIMLCKARKLNPWEGDAYLVGYDTEVRGQVAAEFNLVTSIYAFLKRAEVHKDFDGMKSGVVVRNKDTDEILDVEGDYVYDDCELVGGWAEVFFKNRKITMYRRLALKTFNKGGPLWLSNAPGMICKCAEVDALRASFPNTFGGMYLDGEMPTADPAKPPVNQRLEDAKAAQSAASTNNGGLLPPPPAPSPNPAGAAPRNSAGSQTPPDTGSDAGAGPKIAPASTGARPRARSQAQTCPTCNSTFGPGNVCPSCGPTNGGAEGPPTQQPAPPPPAKKVTAAVVTPPPAAAPVVPDEFQHWRDFSPADAQTSWEAMTDDARTALWRKMPPEVKAIVTEKLK